MGFYPKPAKPTPPASALPDALQNVNEAALRAYLEAVAVVVAEQLQPGVPERLVRELAAAAAQNPGLAGPALDLALSFGHVCRFVGCSSNTCGLCKHNPNKRCAGSDNFCQTFLDKQAIRTRCDAPIEVQLRNRASGQACNLTGIEVQLSVIDGHAYNEAAPSPAATVVKLLRSDKDIVLLGCTGNGGKVLPDGHIIMDLQEGHALLPSSLHVRVTNHVLKVKSFRLLAEAVRRNDQDQYVVDSKIKPAVSARFEVKSNRAATKSAYPHHSEPFTTLKYMGSGSYKTLKDVKACLGPNVPFDSVQTVGELKALIQYADHNKEVENALSELFRFKGEHRDRWAELRATLDQVVLDDNTPRVWYCEDGKTGLLFPCKQGQVNFSKPLALVQQTEEDGVPRAEVVPFKASHQQLAKSLRELAEAAWKTNGHKGWQIFVQQVDTSAAQLPSPTATSAPLNVPGVSGLLHAGSGSSNAAAVLLPHSFGSGSYTAAVGGSSPPPTPGTMGHRPGVLQHQSSDLSNGSMHGGMQPGVGAAPQPLLGFVHDAHQAPLARPSMAALYPPMKACDGSFGFHAAQATYTPAEVVSWGQEELRISDLAAMFDDDGPADMADLHPNLHAELQSDLHNSTMDAGRVAQGQQHGQQPQGFAGLHGLQPSDMHGHVTAAQQHGSCGVVSSLQPGDVGMQTLQYHAGSGAVGAAGAGLAGPSFKRSRGGAAEAEGSAAADLRPVSGRALYHSKSRGRDLRMRFDSDNASLMSESSSLSEQQSEEELNEAMAALAASSTAHAELAQGLDLGGGHALVPSASLPIPPLQPSTGMAVLQGVYGSSAPAAMAGNPFMGSGHAAQLGSAEGTSASASHDANAASPFITDDAFLDDLLTDLGAAHGEDQDLLLPDFLTNHGSNR